MFLHEELPNFSRYLITNLPFPKYLLPSASFSPTQGCPPRPPCPARCRHTGPRALLLRRSPNARSELASCAKLCSSFSKRVKLFIELIFLNVI